jgi:hypothetical protein
LEVESKDCGADCADSCCLEEISASCLHRRISAFGQES